MRHQSTTSPRSCLIEEQHGFSKRLDLCNPNKDASRGKLDARPDPLSRRRPPTSTPHRWARFSLGNIILCVCRAPAFYSKLCCLLQEHVEETEMERRRPPLHQLDKIHTKQTTPKNPTDFLYSNQNSIFPQKRLSHTALLCLRACHLLRLHSLEKRTLHAQIKSQKRALKISYNLILARIYSKYSTQLRQHQPNH